MNTVNAVEQTYYELIFAREKVKVENSALELANQLVAETRKRVEVGDLPPLDEKQAEAQAQLVQTDLYAAEQAVAEEQNALKNLMPDQFPTWVDANLEPNESLMAIPQMFDRTESWRRSGSRRRRPARAPSARPWRRTARRRPRCRAARRSPAPRSRRTFPRA